MPEAASCDYVIVRREHPDPHFRGLPGMRLSPARSDKKFNPSLLLPDDEELPKRIASFIGVLRIDDSEFSA